MKLSLALFFAIVSSVCAQLANQPPQPLWIEGGSELSATFTHEGKLLKAILLGTGDATVTINGLSAGEFHAVEHATSIT
jgi:hypothetical protein